MTVSGTVLAHEVKLGLIKESTFGTFPGGNMYLIPVEPPELREEIEQIVDNGVRGVAAMDFNVFAGMRRTTGTLSGYVYANDSGAAADATPSTGVMASPFAHVLQAFFGADTVAQIDSGSSYIHNFHTARLPGSLALQLEDSLTTTAASGNSNRAAFAYAGIMIPRLTLSFNAAEGMLMWEAELLGTRQMFLNADTSPAAGTIGADLTNKAFVGWQASTHYGAAAANPTSNAEVLSAEITLEREIELNIGANNQQYANIRASRPIQATFTAVIQLRDDYDEYQRYSKDFPHATAANAILDDFTDSIQAWTFRFSTLDGVNTATTDISFDDAGTSDLDADNDAVFDLRFHRVSIGESPLMIARDSTTATMEISARALYSAATPTWFGAAPPSAAQSASQHVQARLINQRSSAY